MKKSIKVTPKKRGRPPSGGRDPARTFRLSDKLIAAIDAWASKNDMTRSEAARSLLMEALEAKDLG